MGTAVTESCENCGRRIGRLETPCAYGEHVVCDECYARLTRQSNPYPPPLPPQPVQAVQPAYCEPSHLDALAAAAASPRPVYYATPRPRYNDRLFAVRLAFLVGGAFVHPILFLAWLALGVYHLIMKSRQD